MTHRQSCTGKCHQPAWRAALGVVVRFTNVLAGKKYVKCRACNITFPDIYAVRLSRGPTCPCCLAPCKTRPYAFGRYAKQEVYRHA